MRKNAAKTKPKSRYSKGIVPSITALRYCVAILRAQQNECMIYFIVHDRGNQPKSAEALAAQADDCDQVATFLENQIRLRK